MIGQIVNGYTIIRKLGEGGMGIVYLAENNVGLKVAVKILKPEFAGDAAMCRRFRRECETMVRLQGHPNVVQINSIADYRDMPVLVMEYLAGGMDLNAYIEKNGAVQDEKLLKNWLLQILKVLDYAHTLSPKIIHRDIKPSNLYLTQFGDIKLLDFGIVKVLEESTNPELTLRTLTTTTSKMGSVSYMSPEQSFDPKLVDERSDIYSLGKTLKVLMTGGDPRIKVSKEPFKSIIEKATQECPDDRYSNVNEIIRELSKQVSGNIENKSTVYPEENCLDEKSGIEELCESKNFEGYKRSTVSSFNSDIADRVKRIIEDKLGVLDLEVVPEARIGKDLGADSLDAIELVMEIEKEFCITIPDDQAERIRTVGDAISYVEANVR